MPGLLRLPRCRQRGQVLVIFAVGMLVIIGFTGLAIDVGIIWTAQRNLERLTDAAALAAAGAMSGPPLNDDATHQQNAVDRANEYVQLNGFDLTVPDNTISVTFPTTNPPRKLVQVQTYKDADLAFMRILGFDRVRVSSGGRRAEAAPLDVTILQDTSISQLIWNYSMGNSSCLVDPAYTGSRDPASNIPATALACNHTYNPARATLYDDQNPTSSQFTHTQWARVYSGTFTNPNVPFLPFARQQWAARYFIGNLDSRYDQVGVADFSTSARLDSALTSNFPLALDAIGNSPETPGQVGSAGLHPTGSTNLAKGLSVALGALTNFQPAGPARNTAVGAMIVLTDGSTTVTLNGSGPGNCSSANYGNSDCVSARQDAMTQAQIAAQSGIIVYSIFIGDATWEVNNALLMQWIADLTEHRGSLHGDYSGTRSLPIGYGPAFTDAQLQQYGIDNYYRADPSLPDSDPHSLKSAFDQILSKIYTRLVEQ